jgi:hypothetical protein
MRLWTYGLDSTYSRERPVAAGFCEHGDEPSGFLMEEIYWPTFKGGLMSWGKFRACSFRLGKTSVSWTILSFKLQDSTAGNSCRFRQTHTQ